MCSSILSRSTFPPHPCTARRLGGTCGDPEARSAHYVMAARRSRPLCCLHNNAGAPWVVVVVVAGRASHRAGDVNKDPHGVRTAHKAKKATQRCRESRSIQQTDPAPTTMLAASGLCPAGRPLSPLHWSGSTSQHCCGPPSSVLAAANAGVRRVAILGCSGRPK